MTDNGDTFTANREQLVDALAQIRADNATVVDGVLTLNAESMADAIIAALADDPNRVHYHWLPVCREPYFSGIWWSDDRDRVTCRECKSATAPGSTPVEEG